MNLEKARKSLSNSVINFRIKNDVSLAELSRMTDISTRTISRIEMSEETGYNAGIDKVFKLSQATKIPVSRLLGQRVTIAL